MTDDNIKTKTITVEIQENGIIRNSKGWIIARTVDDVDFGSEHIYSASPISALVESLKDEGYYVGWKANIAMAVADEHSRYLKRKSIKWADSSDMHEIANDAADNFLKLLMSK